MHLVPLGSDQLGVIWSGLKYDMKRVVIRVAKPNVVSSLRFELVLFYRDIILVWRCPLLKLNRWEMVRVHSFETLVAQHCGDRSRVGLNWDR